MRPQLGFGSGSSPKRAGTGLVPMCAFQASRFVARPRLASNPTPSEVLRGGSAIIVVIRLPPHSEIGPLTRSPRESSFLRLRTIFAQYEGTEYKEAPE